jgi:membrane-anchored glycerophosphoryl diester phosphodiesterase (GDPDase)
MTPRPARRSKLKINPNMISFSWDFLMKNKGFLCVPLVSFACSALLVCFVILPIIVLLHYGRFPLSQSTGVILIILVYILIAFAHLVFTGGLMIYIDTTLHKQKTTFVRACLRSLACWKHLSLWALVSGILSWILHAIENSNRGISSVLIDRILGAAWSVLTFFILPFLVLEKKSVIQSFKASQALIKKNWGTILLSYGILGVVFGLLHVVAIGILYFAFMHLHLSSNEYVLICLLVAIYWITVSSFQVTMWAIFRVVTFRLLVGGDKLDLPKEITPFT